jgi:FkbM family methyltransferase
MAAREDEGVTSEEAEALYRGLLGRPRETPSLGVGTDRVEFVESIVQSEEFRHRAYLLIQENSGRYSLTNTDRGPIVTDNRDAVVGRTIRASGSFQEAEVSQAIEILKDLGRSCSYKTFVDIGANIGSHSLFALKNGFENAICFEPTPGNFRLLRVNQILNEVDRHCRNYQLALSDQEGEVSMHASPDNHGDIRIQSAGTAGNSLHDEAEWASFQVQARRLDTVLEEAGVAQGDISLIWIDTQGHEAKVLSGAQGTLAAGAPVVLEFWPYGLSLCGGVGPLLEQIRLSDRKIVDLENTGEKYVSPAYLEDFYAVGMDKERADFAYHTNLLLT